MDRQALIAATQLKTEAINVAALDGQTVNIKELSGAQRDAWATAHFDPETSDVKPGAMKTLRSSLVCATLVDDEGNRMFTDAEVGLVGEFPSAVLDELYDAAAELSGLSDDAREAILGNFDGGESPSGG